MPMNSSESPVNRLTSSFTDKVTHTPAYKEASVRMLVLGENGESPLPRGNPRFGHRTPQRGVEVERKWNRPDYRMPGSQPVPQPLRFHARKTKASGIEIVHAGPLVSNSTLKPEP